jgi:hypothetical protein
MAPLHGSLDIFESYDVADQHVRQTSNRGLPYTATIRQGLSCKKAVLVARFRRGLSGMCGNQVFVDGPDHCPFSSGSAFHRTDFSTVTGCRG